MLKRFTAPRKVNSETLLVKRLDFEDKEKKKSFEHLGKITQLLRRGKKSNCHQTLTAGSRVTY